MASRILKWKLRRRKTVPATDRFRFAFRPFVLEWEWQQWLKTQGRLLVVTLGLRLLILIWMFLVDGVVCSMKTLLVFTRRTVPFSRPRSVCRTTPGLVQMGSLLLGSLSPSR